MPPKQPKMISYILAKFEMAKKSIWKCKKMITKWQFFGNRFFFAISSFDIIEEMASEFGAFILSVPLPRPTQCLEA